MTAKVSPRRTAVGNISLRDFAETALRQRTLSGVSRMLQHLAKSFRAYGCILWQASPFSDLTGDPPHGYFFVLAQWFPGEEVWVIHDLPLDSSTGRAVLSQTTINVKDRTQDPRVSKIHPFLEEHGIQSFCSVPITFLDGKLGSLNVYRCGLDPFSSSEVRDLREAASLVPSLYQSILNWVSLDLLGKVNGLLRKAQADDLSTEQAYTRLKEICQVIAKAFQCLETTVILEDVVGALDTYKVATTTWPGKLKRSSYEASRTHGLTGWVLEKGQPVAIFDLAHFERDRVAIRRRYPGIRWKDLPRLMSRAKSYLPAGSRRDRPPLSFMAAPMMVGKHVLGVIRCSLPTKDPFYFAEPQLSLLSLVANQIGQFWNDLQARSIIRQENRSWKSLVESVGKLNNFVYHELNQELPQERRMFAEALRATSTAVQGADIMDVRMFDPKSKELFFLETAGDAWNKGEAAEIAERKERRYAIGPGKPASAGAHVFRTGKVYVIHDTHQDPYYSETFPETRRMILSPIRIEESIFGVLDIRGTGHGSFPVHALVMAELLGNQLGLYHFLATTIGKLKQTETALTAKVEELSSIQRHQTQTLEDLTHQLKSPILLAHARAQEILKGKYKGENLRPSLEAIRGLCGKAKRAILSVPLFADLASERPSQLTFTPLYFSDLTKLLLEAASDHELMIEPDRRIRFQVNQDSFAILRNLRVSVDRDLLEQAISNLLDNAGKYSFSDTIVQIHGGMTKVGRFHITVKSQGLTIRPVEVRQCTLRGWRSDTAKLATGEGSGIGLWIVHHIMQAHQGDLVILPTQAQSQNEIKLVFPVR